MFSFVSGVNDFWVKRWKDAQRLSFTIHDDFNFGWCSSFYVIFHLEINWTDMQSVLCSGMDFYLILYNNNNSSIQSHNEI